MKEGKRFEVVYQQSVGLASEVRILRDRATGRRRDAADRPGRPACDFERAER